MLETADGLAEGAGGRKIPCCLSACGVGELYGRFLLDAIR